MFRRWEGRPRWVGALALAMLVALVASGCGASAARSQPTDSSTGASTLSAEAARNVAVQTWVRHLAAAVALDANSFPNSEAGFQLESDKLATPVDVAEGEQENQYQPTGNVAWVALPSRSPQLVMLARIKTTWQPQPSSSVQETSGENLVVLERQGVGKKWRIVAYPALDPSPPTQLSEVRELKGAYPSHSSSSLPVGATSLPAKYWSYVTGAGPSEPFAPGPFTDQLRASYQQEATTYSSQGDSLSFPFEGASQIGTYAVGTGGDALVVFGLRFASVQNASNASCFVQSSAHPSFPTIVPDGRYAQVRLEYRSVRAALEQKSTGMVTILGEYTVLVGETTTPTTAPACL